MISICFAGVTGWTAGPILADIDRADDLTVVAGVSRSAAGRSLAELTGLPFDGRVHASVADAYGQAPADVMIDFTSAAAVRGNVRAALEAGAHIVVGSSGLTAEDYADLDRHARSRGVGIVAAGNFSILAAVLRRAATIAADHVDRWEIIDYASDAKPDVPSGTSRELAETLGEIRQPANTLSLADLQGPVEARGTDVGGTRIHSVRLPSFLVSTEIIFAAAGERLTIRHDPGLTADPYVAGTLLAVRAVTHRVGLIRGLDALLFGPTPSRTEGS
jgi:4-hydroxy-tetrahydrodipicolinate reductase